MAETGKEPKPETPLTREDRLERALQSPMTDLPENRPRGLLGDRGLNVAATDDLSQPDLNSGISQEHDTSVIWLVVVLGFLLGFLPGFIVLWVSKKFSLRTKVVYSIAGVILAAAIVVAYASRR